MRILILIHVLFVCFSLSAQYDAGTIIYSETNINAIQKNYKIVDFDGDGLLDIIAIRYNRTFSLTWFKGNGNGTYAEQNDLLEVGNEHKENEIHFVDMNGDGIEDIVFQNSHTSFTTLLNDGQGNIIEQIENETTTEQFVGTDLKTLVDLDGDGDMDGIFFAKTDSSTWGSYYDLYFGYSMIGHNQGDGTFTNYKQLENEQEVLVLVKTGDIDGDGDTDFICSGNREIVKNAGEGAVTYENPFIRLYENLGEAGIAEKVELDLPRVENVTGTAETDLMHIKLQDLNNDGTDELFVEHAFIEDCASLLHLIGCDYTYEFHILEYDVQNEKFAMLEKYDSWQHNYTLQQGFRSYNELYDDAFLIQFGHQNKDDNLDILSVNVPQGKIIWNLGNGEGGFETNPSQTVHTNNEYSDNKPTLRLADADNDGDLDVFVLLNTETSSTLTLFKNETPVSINSQNFVFGKMGITPNQTQGNSYIHLNLEQQQPLNNSTYNLYTIEGVKLTSSNIKDNKIFIPDLPTGMYLVNINIKDKNYIEKIIIK